jgi:hypothetical protein
MSINIQIGISIFWFDPNDFTAVVEGINYRHKRIL